MNLQSKPFYLSEEDVSWVNGTLSGMTEEEKIAQLFCLVAYTSDERYLDYLSKGLKIGGIMCRTMAADEVVKTVTHLQQSSKIPLLISANLESGGDGVAKEGTRLGCEMAVAATGKIRYGKLLGEICGREGSALGVNWAFAPIADVDMNFRNPITNTRTFGANCRKVADLSCAYIKAVQQHGVAACAKHFPGDGVDERDQHLVSSVNSLSYAKWNETYGKIYRRCIDAGVMTVMVGHIMQPACSKAFNPSLRDGDILPASLSRELVTDLLKGALGFNGLVITDSAFMAGFASAMERRKAVPMTIAAGCDMFLFTKNLEEDFRYMREGVKDGTISSRRLDEAVTKILALKAALGLHKDRMIPDPEKVASVVGCPEHRKEAARCADDSITLVKNIQNVLPLNPGKHRRVLFYSLESGKGGLGYDPSQGANSRFLELLRKEGFEVEEYVPKKGFEGMFESSESVVKNYDLIVYCANLATRSNQTVVRIEWKPMGTDIPTYVHSVPTIFISLENPYHLLDVPRVRTYINTYGSSDEILKSLMDKLMGRSDFKGRSPVDAFCGKWDTRL